MQPLRVTPSVRRAVTAASGVLPIAFGEATKTVSWVPVLTWFVPDEREHVRIRLKLALIDVRSGSWSVLSPPPFDSATLSVGKRRAVADQKLVERLKDRAYEASARELMKSYAAAELSSKFTNE